MECCCCIPMNRAMILCHLSFASMDIDGATDQKPEENHSNLNVKTRGIYSQKRLFDDRRLWDFFEIK